MPGEKDLTKCIPKIYKRKYEDIGMFFFVEAQKQIVPTIKIYQAIRNYYKFISEEISDYDMPTLIVTLSQMRAEFIDMNFNNLDETS
jgi:hypothetical protein